MIFKNNIFSNFHRVIVTEGTELGGMASSTWDYNLYFNINSGDSSQAWNYSAKCANGGGGYCSFPQWQTVKPDSHGQVTTAAPNYGPSFQLQTGSPAIGFGANLSSLCTGNVALLCSDKSGAARPGGNTAWDAGASLFAGGNIPNPPTGLNATVQ